ncbi:MAG: HAMP domain-containing sensor histidine kinase [Bacteroidales bacterium]|nr:HAMP domain-containing sensor histidine kinase [Bacteroidales bacterium]MDD3891232.1 HAMP domain-containing sensor histidine kinase [Bacteroidales bacterium]
MEPKITDDELLNELKRRIEHNKITVKELKALNEELKLVNEKLGESESLKSHFISNITNEIINPFTSILGLSRAILSVDKENWKKVVSMVALIYSEAFTLDFQFRNIFVAAKIEAGEIFPEIINTDVLSVIESVLEAFRVEARRKKVSVTLDHSFKVDDQGMSLFKTDPEKLKLILANLLNNAINFSHEGGVVEVIGKVDKGSLVICVRDYGIGISKENQKIIFDRFKRLDSGINSLNRGHGLGLSVNKAVIEMLNGKIDIQSELGKGSCFTISIPESDAVTFDFASDANETFFDSEEEIF